ARQGQMEEAMADCNRAVVLAPSYAPAYFERAKLQGSRQQLPEALADYSTAIRLQPHEPLYRESRTQLAWQLGNSPLQTEDLEELLRLEPNNGIWPNNLAWILVTGPQESRNVERGLELAERAADLERGNAYFLKTLGVARYRTGHYSEAIQALEAS